MTFTEQIEEALKKPVDQGLMQECSGIVWIAMLSSKGNFFSLDREGDMDCKVNPTHWKPINLPSVLTK